jgi:hypothetical protein
MRTVFSGGAGVSSVGSRTTTPSSPAAPSGGDARDASGRAIAATGTGQITRLEVDCGHGGRVATDGQTLFLVANNGVPISVTWEFPLPGGQPDEKLSFAIGGQDGRSDTIARVVVETDGQGAGRRQVCVKENPSPPTEDQWSSTPRLPHTVDAPPVRGWPGGLDRARTLYVFGRGDGTPHKMVTVKILPSWKREFTLSVRTVASWVNQVKRRINTAIPRIGPAQVRVDGSPPSGSFSFSYGWEEVSGSRDAKFHIEANSGLRPLAGIDLELRVSLIQAGGSAALAAIGIVPPLSTRVLSFCTDNAIDIYFFIGGGVNVGLLITGSRDDYATGRSESSLRVRAPISGEVRMGLAGRVGDPEEPTIELRGQVATGIEVEPALHVRSEGLVLGIVVNWPGVTISATITSCIGLSCNVGSFTVCGPRQLYPAEGAPAGTGEWRLTGPSS